MNENEKAPSHARGSHVRCYVERDFDVPASMLGGRSLQREDNLLPDILSSLVCRPQWATLRGALEPGGFGQFCGYSCRVLEGAGKSLVVAGGYWSRPGGNMATTGKQGKKQLAATYSRNRHASMVAGIPWGRIFRSRSVFSFGFAVPEGVEVEVRSECLDFGFVRQGAAAARAVRNVAVRWNPH